MYRIVFNAIFTLAAAPVVVLGAQPQGAQVVSSEIAISRDRAEIKLELDNGRKVVIATTAGAEHSRTLPLRRAVSGNEESLTLEVPRGDAVDRSWRNLLDSLMDANSAEIGTMLRDWTAPSSSGSEFDRAIEAALAAGAPAITPPRANAVAGQADLQRERDSLARELERALDRLNEVRDEGASGSGRHRGPDWLAPVRHVARGITGIFSVLVTYTVLFGIGFVMVMFGGRKYIEAVAETATFGMGRAFLVGLAGSFLLIPVYVLGIIALAISIVGIPALLIWIPLFPVGALLAALLGFLGVAYSLGESWAEKRYYGSEWFNRANSYYFMASGLALLSAFFIAANVMTMAGPWLGFLNNMLNFFGIVVTWIAATIGLGAVLISRGGLRDAAANPLDPSFTEGAGV